MGVGGGGGEVGEGKVKDGWVRVMKWEWER